jgi:hypothetical protein
MLQARDEHAGLEAKCPSCERVSTIPTAEEAARARRPDALRADQPRRGRYDDEPADRPRRRHEDRPEPRTSTMAMLSLVLGLASMTCVLAPILVLPTLLLGALALREASNSRGEVSGGGLAVAGMMLSCLGLAIGLTLWFTNPLGPLLWEPQHRSLEANNLKQIGLAFHNVHDTTRSLPMAVAYRSPDGKPLLSWRVVLLPYLEQDNLFRQFRFDEPWDSPHNLRLLPLIPKVYQRAGEKPDGRGLTHYQVPVGKSLIFDEAYPGARTVPPTLRLGRGLFQITDGTSNTIMVVTAKDGVPWTKPEDFEVTVGGPIVPRLDTKFGSGPLVLFADGLVRPMRRSLPDMVWYQAMTAEGGEVLSID